MIVDIIDLDDHPGEDGPQPGLRAMLRLDPTADIETRLQTARAEVRAFGDDWQFNPRIADQREYVLQRVASFEKDLKLALQRDALQARRPNGCWCLGTGGKQERQLRRTQAIVYSDHCQCPDGAARLKADEGAVEAEQREVGKRNAKAFRDSLPFHFCNYSLDSYPARADKPRTILKSIRTWAEGDDDELLRWLYLHGPYGTGKTGLAIAAAAAAIEHRQVVCAEFVPVPELLDRLRHTFKKGAEEDEADVMEKYRDAELLILDDLGAERSTDWALERLFVLLNHRHGDHLPTIVTSNLTPAELGEHIGHRTMHRIAELAQVVSLADCPDLRAQARKPRLVKKDEGAA